MVGEGLVIAMWGAGCHGVRWQAGCCGAGLVTIDTVVYRKKEKRNLLAWHIHVDTWGEAGRCAEGEGGGAVIDNDCDPHCHQTTWS